MSNLRERLLPSRQNNEVHCSGIWHGQPNSFSGDPLSAHSSTPLLDGPTSLQQQEDYLRSLTENATEDNFQVESLEPSSQLSMSPDQMGSLLEAITSGQEFPGSSTLTSQNSSSGMWHTSSVPFGDTSAAFSMISNDPSFLTPSINGQFCQSQHAIVTGAGIITSSSLVTGGSDYTPSYSVTQSMGDIDGCPQQGVSSDLAGINPFNAGTEIDIDRYHIPDLEVKFCDLENRVFEKQQSRKDKKARQRIINGKVRFLVRSERQVKTVQAWVQREEHAAKLEKDENGMVSIEVVFLRKLKDSGSLEYQVDLDSVYKMDGSERPVYKLAKVHTQERNLFELLVQMVFTDNNVSGQFKSKPFLIKTKRLSDEQIEPGTHFKEKRKRPNTLPTSCSRWNRGKQAVKYAPLQNEADSTEARSPLSASSMCSRNSPFSSEGDTHLDELVVKHLTAQQANIDCLTFSCMMQTPRGDIAYHLRLTNPDLCQTLDEGVVVGFFGDDGGVATIEPLSNENVSQAVMAGVISRSAYVEAHAPSESDKGQTDIVCVIGMVKVQIVGSVQTGERIYASTDNPGTGVPESHLPLGAFIIRNHTLLGMAMETCKSRYHDEVNLVKSFVCIVLGINSRQLSNEVENIMENIDMDIKVAIGKSNKRTCRRMFFLITGLLICLGLMGFLLYEVLTPGTRWRHFLCHTGSNSGQTKMTCKYSSAYEDINVRFIPFDFKNLLSKIPTGERKPTTTFQNPDSPIYFLNYDRCAYGGRTDSSMYSPEDARPVRGPTYLASYGNCSKVFSFMWDNWTLFNDSRSRMRCLCSGVETLVCKWILLMLSFSAYRFLTYH